jgi:RHS repeat-associated protein
VGRNLVTTLSSNPWQYDENNRLIKIGEGNCGSSNTICYDYDAAGNRIKKTEGNKTTSYKYDTLNRLIEVSQGNGNNEQLIARYGYDPFNRRIWKEQFGDKNGQSLAQAKRTYFLYSDEGLLAEEEQDITLNGDGSTIASGQPILATQYGPKPDSLFTTGILFVKTKNSNNEDIIAYYHHDHLNTPIQATDKKGNIVWSAMYQAFGRVTITTPNPTPEHPVIVSNLRFPGQYEDSETGLYYNWNRYYSPETGRYVTNDPIGLEGGINRYLYTKANPLSYSDSKGLKELTLSCCQTFQRLINFDNQQSSSLGVLFAWEYSPLNFFGGDIMGLNCSFESIGGPVDIDWMLRTAGWGLGSVPGFSHAAYFFGKPLWNIVNGADYDKNISEPSHFHAPSAARYWMNSGMPLEQLFAPAVEECKQKFGNSCSIESGNSYYY